MCLIYFYFGLDDLQYKLVDLMNGKVESFSFLFNAQKPSRQRYRTHKSAICITGWDCLAVYQKS